MTIEIIYIEEDNEYQAECIQFHNMRVRAKTARASVESLLGAIELLGVRLDKNEQWEETIRQTNRRYEETRSEQSN